MTNELVEKYACALKDEQEAFNVYKHIAKWDPDNKATILQIMSEEVRHYEIVHKILFAKINTPIELAYSKTSEMILSEMKECLAEMKK